MHPDYTGVVETILLVFFLPFLVSLFGRMIFIFAAFAFCCLTLVACGWGLDRPHSINILLIGGPWTVAWICAIVGIKTKRAARLRLAALREHRRATIRGKNRAMS